MLTSFLHTTSIEVKVGVPKRLQYGELGRIADTPVTMDDLYELGVGGVQSAFRRSVLEVRRIQRYKYRTLSPCHQYIRSPEQKTYP